MVLQGGWALDMKHGLGRKVYANGDTYEGLWQHGRAEGPGRYKWQNRNEYDGQLQVGRMNGQGTLMWSTGGWHSGTPLTACQSALWLTSPLHLNTPPRCSRHAP